MKKYLVFKSPIGKIKITEQDSKIIEIKLIDDDIFVEDSNCKSKILLQTKKELEEYFSLKRKTFDIPIKFSGSDFKLKVWNELLNIPYGKTKSYGVIATLMGNKKASRAVGMACNRNPLMIVVPCHRVIGKNKKLVGYAGGIDIKQKLLDLESGNVND